MGTGISWATLHYVCRSFENQQCPRGKDSAELRSCQNDITFSFPFSLLSRDHYISKQHWLPLLSTVLDKMADVYWLFILGLCILGSHALWSYLKHDFITCPKVLRLCYSVIIVLCHSWQKSRACHFLLLHTKNGRLPNAKTLDHGRTSQHVQCPLENKESENRLVVN